MGIFNLRKQYKKRIGRKNKTIDPDEIFLDSHNLPEFDVNQCEGVFEKPLSYNVFRVFILVFILIAVLYAAKAWFLQVKYGEAYVALSEQNSVRHQIIFPTRGNIYDRNGIPLAWNSANLTDNDYALRNYATTTGLGNVLGYVKYPAKDSSGIYYKKEYSGVAGIESSFQDKLQGAQGLKIVETNALNKVVAESVIEAPTAGENLTLSIDSRIQSKMYDVMQNLAQRVGFSGGAGAIMDIKTGELIALTSYPTYSPSVLTNGTDTQAIRSYFNDPQNPLLDRPVSGLYAPGSIVKPYVAVGALEEGVITPDKQILSTGSIRIQNPYYPDKYTVFNDWQAQGWVDMRHAIQMSSDVYFYEIGGGFQDQKGLGIENINKYMDMFGFGKVTGVKLSGEQAGVVPDPKWKEQNYTDGTWRIGDTYLTAIGQYGFQATLIQAVRAVSAIAEGKLVTPQLLKDSQSEYTTLPVANSSLQVAREGMRLSAESGTAKGLSYPDFKIAAKTGTAEIGVKKDYVNSWVTGFFPYDNPRYAFTIVMEHGPESNLLGGVYVMRQLFDWMKVNTPEYIN